MPFGRLEIVVHGAAPPLSTVCRFDLIRSSCKPTLKTLHCSMAVLNGPGAVLLMPSGKNGRCRNPPARSVKATDPSNFKPLAPARSTYDPKPATRNRAPALALE